MYTVHFVQGTGTDYAHYKALNMPPPPHTGKGQPHVAPSQLKILQHRKGALVTGKVIININSVADPGCLSRIPDPTFFHPGYRIRIVSIPYPKKWFLSSMKYDPGCSSRIPDPGPDFYSSWIPDPGYMGHSGSRIRISNTA